jgi:cytosine permease
MTADDLISGRCWSGPRQATNWAGYGAWLPGFLVGIPDHVPGLSAAWIRADDRAVLYSFGVGFVLYIALSMAGLRPPVMGSGLPACIGGAGRV